MGYQGNTSYASVIQPNPGPGAGAFNWFGIPYVSSGGGHGGAGQTVCDTGSPVCQSCVTANGGIANDDPIHPSLMGSGGGELVGNGETLGVYSNGGGLLQVVVLNPSSNVLGTATINGTIDMSGIRGCPQCGPLAESGGGGAGGTILIEASTISGTGLLQANGGICGGNWGGAGGGGIISLITNSSSFPGTISVAGGNGDYSSSPCGTGWTG